MAETLKFGNGTWATKNGSTLAYNDEDNNYKPLPFSFERDSIATRVNKEGLIEVVGNNIPRIDYTDSTEGALLLENSATNLITYSEAFDNAYWTKSNTLILTNEIISPNGTLTSEKLYEDTANSTKLIFKTGLSTLGTISVFAKKADDNNRLFQIRRDGGSNSWSWFDLEDGTIQSEENGIASIDKLDNGWYRCSFTPTNSNGTIVFGISNGSLGRSVSYQGDGTSGVYIWGAMLEANSVASSYIPTNGSTVQRAAETCNGSGNSEVFNDSQGVLFANIAANADDLTQRALGVSDGTSSNRMSIVYNDGSSNSLRMFVTNPSGTKSYITNSFNITQNNKISIKLNGTSLSFWVNGFEIHTDTLNSAFGSDVLDTLDFAFFGTNTPFYGKTKEIGYYDEILTDAELETLTSYRSLNEMVTELNLNAL